MNAEHIEKEALVGLKFPTDRVLDPEKRQHLMQQLEKAMKLGNTDHVKVQVHFHTLEGLKKVETTIWALDEHEVTFKSGMFIPVNAIERVDFI